MHVAANRESSMDVAALPLAYRHGQQLNESPCIWLFRDFASAAEMQALIASAQPKMAPAEVSGETGGFLSQGRSGCACWVSHDYSALTLALAQRISRLVEIPLSHAENFQVVYYGRDQEYKAHFDGWEQGTERGDRCLAHGGQRLWTALLYLNDVERGGCTRFPKLELDVQPVKGSLLLFHNCERGSSKRHDHSLHAGMPVTAGEKWAANLWFRQREYRWQGALGPTH
jgi:prolyl 4-hydroxylase